MKKDNDQLTDKQWLALLVLLIILSGVLRMFSASAAAEDAPSYTIPQAVLDADPAFAAIMEEAEKYIGFPYVYGGSNPEKGFDCSGFVCWVYREAGVYNGGRKGAKSLKKVCAYVAPGDARPGDLIFFTDTMGPDVKGITHVGIYVGNDWMLHCGDPIGYADLRDLKWAQKFHSFGRLPLEGGAAD